MTVATVPSHLLCIACHPAGEHFLSRTNDILHTSRQMMDASRDDIHLFFNSSAFMYSSPAVVKNKWALPYGTLLHSSCFCFKRGIISCGPSVLSESSTIRCCFACGCVCCLHHHLIHISLLLLWDRLRFCAHFARSLSKKNHAIAALNHGLDQVTYVRRNHTNASPGIQCKTQKPPKSVFAIIEKFYHTTSTAPWHHFRHKSAIK